MLAGMQVMAGLQDSTAQPPAAPLPQTAQSDPYNITRTLKQQQQQHQQHQQRQQQQQPNCTHSEPPAGGAALPTRGGNKGSVRFHDLAPSCNAEDDSPAPDMVDSTAGSSCDAHNTLLHVMSGAMGMDPGPCDATLQSARVREHSTGANQVAAGGSTAGAVGNGPGIVGDGASGATGLPGLCQNSGRVSSDVPSASRGLIEAGVGGGVVCGAGVACSYEVMRRVGVTTYTEASFAASSLCCSTPAE